MQVERRCVALIRATELGVTAIADGDVLQAAVDDEIDERGGSENAVGDEIPAEPVEAGADERANDDDGETNFGIEILADVEVSAAADRAAIDQLVIAHRLADRQG